MAATGRTRDAGAWSGSMSLSLWLTLPSVACLGSPLTILSATFCARPEKQGSINLDGIKVLGVGHQEQEQVQLERTYATARIPRSLHHSMTVSPAVLLWPARPCHTVAPLFSTFIRPCSCSSVLRHSTILIHPLSTHSHPSLATLSKWPC